MFDGLLHIRQPMNEPAFDYEPGSRVRAELKAEFRRLLATPVEALRRTLGSGELPAMVPISEEIGTPEAASSPHRSGGRVSGNHET